MPDVWKWVGAAAMCAAALLLFVYGLVWLVGKAREGHTTYRCENTSQSTFVCTREK